MNATFKKLKERKGEFGQVELNNIVDDLVQEIINDEFVSVSKKWSGYGTWKSEGFANEYHFCNELAELITKATTGVVTHDEDREFVIADFEENLKDVIYDYLY